MLSNQLKVKILRAIREGRRAHETRAGLSALSFGAATGSGYVLLTNGHGLTDAGRFYYSRTGEHAPVGGVSMTQQPVRRGDTEYVMDSHGIERRARTLHNGEWQYTALGRVFFSSRKVEFVVGIPCTVHGVRKNGTQYTIGDVLFPVDKLGIGQIMGHEAEPTGRQAERIKAEILRALGTVEGDGQGHQRLVICEISTETYVYDPNGQWTISSMTTQPGADGAIDTEVRMNRPLGCLSLSAASFLPYADHIIPQAFERHEDKLCLPRQLAAVTEEPLEDICANLDCICPEGWREEGVSPADVLEWCKQRGRPFCFLDKGVVERWSPEAPRGKTVCFTCFNGHAYCYDSARLFSSWAERAPQAPLAGAPAHLESEPRESTAPPFAEWREFKGVLEPGHFYTETLRFWRQKLLASGRSPKPVMKSLLEMSALKYQCHKAVDKVSGLCTIKEVPRHFQEIAGFMQRLGLEYHCEGLAVASMRALMHLLRVERRSPPVAERERLLQEHGGLCAMCKRESATEWDHVAPLHQLAGQAQTYQPLCEACHAQKTEDQGFHQRALHSRVSKRVWDEYVRSPRPPPLVWASSGDVPAQDFLHGAFEIDVRRCRASALRFSSHEFCVLCPLDSLRRSEAGKLADFSFVEPRAPPRSAPLSMLPFVGAGWYHRVAVEFGLHHQKITWDDILWSLSATGRLPADVFAEPLRAMDAAWGDTDMSKLATNALIGLMATDQLVRFHCVTSTHRDDLRAPPAVQTTVVFPGGSTTDWVCQTPILTNATLRPIHDQIMHTEHVRVAQILYVVERLGIPPRCVRYLKTDAVILQDFPKPSKTKGNLRAIGNVVFGDLPHLRAKFEPGVRLRCADVRGKPIARAFDDVLVYRCSEECRPLRGAYRGPWRDAIEPTEAPAWRSLKLVEAACHLRSRKGSLAVMGAPGVGKTTWLQQRIAELRGQGLRVHCVAKTHVACANLGMDCVTADHYVRKHIRNGHCGADVLVVDECFQIDANLWADLVKPFWQGCRYILAGDPAQFGPILEHWAGSPVPQDLLKKRSDMLRELVGGCRLSLQKCRRCDTSLFDFYVGLRVGQEDERPVAEVLAEARQRYPATDQDADYTLTLSHVRRVQVNGRMNRKRLAEHRREATFLRCKQEDSDRWLLNKPQSMWIWPGLELVGAGGATKKGMRYTIESVEDEAVALVGGLRLSHEQVIQQTRLSYCLTYAGMQGLTLQGRVRLETGGPAFTTQHLYVGLSRATSSELVEVL